MAASDTGNSDSTVTHARAAAASRRWDEASGLFRDADDRLSLGADDLKLYATASYLLGQVDMAVDAMTRAHRLHLDADELEEAVRCAFWVIFMLLNRGDTAQAGGWIARVGSLANRLPQECAEQGYMQLFHAFRLIAVEGRHGEGSAAAHGAAAIGRRLKDEDLVAMSLNIEGRALIIGGDPNGGLERLDEAMAAVVSGSVSPIVAGTVYCSLIEACTEISDWRRAGEWTEALTRWCDRQEGMVMFTGQCLTHRAQVLRRQGRWEAAVDEAHQACKRFEGGRDSATGAALYELAETHRLRGETAAAEDAYLRAGEWGHDPQPGLALLRLADGKLEAAEAALRRLMGETSDAVDRLRLLPACVEVMLASSDVAAAEEAAAELTELADVYGTEALQAAAAFARGAVVLHKDDPEAALAELRKAEGGWRSLEAVYETARTKLLISRACILVGDEDAGRMEREAARRVFTELGAVVDLRRLDEARGRPAHGLTDRELQVLSLVATGMTNQAIADEVHLATKTIDRHVGNILSKLGVPSRTAATAFAYEHGLLQRHR